MLSLRKFIFDWWPLITAVAWSILVFVMVVVILNLNELTKGVSRLATNVGNTKLYIDHIKQNFEYEKSKLHRRISENEIHLQSQSARMDVIEKRLNNLLPTKEKLKRQTKEGTVVMREYILIPPKKRKPAKNAEPVKNPD